jgi:hypothetical protein
MTSEERRKGLTKYNYARENSHLLDYVLLLPLH